MSSLLIARTGEVICVVLKIVAKIGRADSEAKGEASRSMLGVPLFLMFKGFR